MTLTSKVALATAIVVTPDGRTLTPHTRAGRMTPEMTAHVADVTEEHRALVFRFLGEDTAKRLNPAEMARAARALVEVYRRQHGIEPSTGPTHTPDERFARKVKP